MQLEGSSMELLHEKFEAKRVSTETMRSLHFRDPLG